MKTLIYLSVVTLLSVGFGLSAEPEKVAPKEAAVMIEKAAELQVVDVRTTEEFEKGHLQGAVLIPWTDNDFKERAAKELDKTKPVLVYCRSGRRSTAASEALAKLGFTKLHNLDGGITAWQKAGKSITK